MGQGSYVFSEKTDYLDYINMSGGYSDYADESNVFILKVDGSARKASRGLINWNKKKDRLEMAAFSGEETNSDFLISTEIAEALFSRPGRITPGQKSF
jgi:hypothetical protein